MNELQQPGDSMVEPARPRGPIMVAALVVLGFVVIAVVAWWLNRSPLAGDRSHDFGVVLFDSPPAFVEHTFTLTNRTRDTLDIQAVRPW